MAGMPVMLMAAGRDADLFSFRSGPRGGQSDDVGQFTIAGVPAGSYLLSAGGGGGVFGSSDEIFIDSTGTPRARPASSTPAPEPGTIEVTVRDGNVTGLRLIVHKSR